MRVWKKTNKNRAKHPNKSHNAKSQTRSIKESGTKTRMPEITEHKATQYTGRDGNTREEK